MKHAKLLKKIKKIIYYYYYFFNIINKYNPRIIIDKSNEVIGPTKKKDAEGPSNIRVN